MTDYRNKLTAAVRAEFKRVTPFEFDGEGNVTNPDVLRDAWEDGDEDASDFVKGISISISQTGDDTFDCDVSLHVDHQMTIWLSGGEERAEAIESLLKLDEDAIAEVTSTFLSERWIENFREPVDEAGELLLDAGVYLSGWTVEVFDNAVVVRHVEGKREVYECDPEQAEGLAGEMSAFWKGDANRVLTAFRFIKSELDGNFDFDGG